MNNHYIYIGNDLIAGPLEKEKPNLNPQNYDIGDDAFYQEIKDWWNKYIVSIPKIEVNGTHSWEINQILIKDIDFVIAESSLKEGIIIEAIPLSKPNTDVKQNLVASNSANGIDCCDAPVSCTNTEEQKKHECLHYWEWGYLGDAMIFCKKCNKDIDDIYEADIVKNIYQTKTCENGVLIERK